MIEPIATRRRGAVLEEALLDAAWAELAGGGYRNFTFEGVIQRAGTSRSVLYRRWPNKLALAVAAVLHYMKRNPLSVPDLGSVRDELILLLRKYADRTPPEATMLLFEMTSDMVAAGHSFSDERFRENLLGEILERGAARGEIDASRLTARIASVPTSLVLFELMVTLEPISDESLAEIVDEVFLPIVGFCRAT